MALFDVGLVNGKDGKDGKSAYQYAVDSGYKGTEAEFNSTLGNLGLTFSSTLLSGETTLVFEDERLTTESVLDSVYTSVFGVKIKSATFGEGTLTLEFPSQEADMEVKVVVDADVSDNLSGASGEKGADGKDGKDGVDGKSAYQYAVDGGYEGTEEEFASLMASGGNAPTEGETSWALCGEVTGNNPITLPNDWEELKIEFYHTTAKDYSTYTLGSKNTLDAYKGANSDIELYLNYNGYADTMVTYNGITLSKWFYVKDVAGSNVNIKVYYKKKSPITVNVGTESNWAYWGSATGQGSNNTVTLPTDWEELKLVTYVRNTNGYTKYIEETLLKHNYVVLKNSTSNGCEIILTSAYNTQNNNHYYRINPTSNTVYHNVEGTFETTYLYVYYKKKCDNVLDINDLGEWKLQGEVTGKTSITLPSDFNEILIEGNLVYSSYSVNDFSTILITKSMLSSSQKRYHLQSMYTTSQTTMSVDVSLSSVIMSTFYYNGKDASSTSKIKVYYR